MRSVLEKGNVFFGKNDYSLTLFKDRPPASPEADCNFYYNLTSVD